MAPSSKKLDVVREHAAFFHAARDPELVKLPAAKYLTLEGEGDPEGPSFKAAVGELYGIAYTLKMAKKALGRDFTVAPLEGLWWSDAERRDGELWRSARESWRWKLMIMLPDFIRSADVSSAAQRLAERRAEALVGTARLERLAEGLCVQALHVGPYATEAQTIARMREVMEARHLAPRGKHHEIYLGDPRRARPEKLKTILRQAVARA